MVLKGRTKEEREKSDPLIHMCSKSRSIFKMPQVQLCFSEDTSADRRTFPVGVRYSTSVTVTGYVDWRISPVSLALSIVKVLWV